MSLDADHHFLAMCSGAEQVDVADAAHMVVDDRNDVFMAALVEFVARVAPASGTEDAQAMERGET